MAVPKVLKEITKQQKLCEFVEQFVVTHRQELADALTSVFQRDAEEGQPTPDFPAFVDTLLRRLRRSLDELVEAERKHLDELSDDALYRQLRDEEARTLRRVVVDVRGFFRSAFGTFEAEKMGFEREVAQDPLALLRQTTRLVERLRRPDLVLPAARYVGLAVTPSAVVAELEPRVAALREALDHVTEELSKAQGTQVEKDRAQRVFSEAYSLIVSLLQASFRLAGRSELAARLRRPIARRPSPSGDDIAAGDPSDGQDDGQDDGGDPIDDVPLSLDADTLDADTLDADTFDVDAFDAG